MHRSRNAHMICVKVRTRDSAVQSAFFVPISLLQTINWLYSYNTGSSTAGCLRHSRFQTGWQFCLAVFRLFTDLITSSIRLQTKPVTPEQRAAKYGTRAYGTQAIFLWQSRQCRPYLGKSEREVPWTAEVKEENEGPYHGRQKSKKKTKGRTMDGRSQRRKRRAVPWTVEVKEDNEGPCHGWQKSKKNCKWREIDSVRSRPTKSHAFRVRLTHFGLLSRSHAHGTKSHAWR